MNKEMLKKFKLGAISLMTFGVLAACATNDGIEEPPMDDPAVEDPADEPADDMDDMDGVDETDDGAGE